MHLCHTVLWNKYNNVIYHHQDPLVSFSKEIDHFQIVSTALKGFHIRIQARKYTLLW